MKTAVISRTYAALTGVVLLLLIVVDRLTKLYALQLKHPVTVVPFLQFSLQFNRGISFSLLNNTTIFGYWAVTTAILCMVGYLLYYIWRQYGAGLFIVPELLVAVGAISNLCDRFIYRGVIDFIAISFGQYQFPVFNVADLLIVVGVFGMFFAEWYKR